MIRMFFGTSWLNR